MKTIILTGGIATGKSTVINLLKEIDPHVIVFDCDAYVASLFNSDTLHTKLISIFGENVIAKDGSIAKDHIRQSIFNDPSLKQKLEALIHPLVRKECLALHQNTLHNNSARAFIIDIPLFYETLPDYPHDLVLVVSLTAQSQRERLRIRNQFPDSLIDSILKNQLPLKVKEDNADILLWNEGSPQLLKQQVVTFYNHYIHA